MRRPNAPTNCANQSSRRASSRAVQVGYASTTGTPRRHIASDQVDTDCPPAIDDFQVVAMRGTSADMGPL